MKRTIWWTIHKVENDLLRVLIVYITFVLTPLELIRAPLALIGIYFIVIMFCHLFGLHFYDEYEIQENPKKENKA